MSKKKVAKTVDTGRKSKRVVTNENMIVNGSVVNKGVIGENRFPVGTRFWLQNESYVEEFKVTEAMKDSGTEHRRIRGGANDVVVMLSYLQSQYGLGQLSLIDDKGNIIKHKTR